MQPWLMYNNNSYAHTSTKLNIQVTLLIFQRRQHSNVVWLKNIKQQLHRELQWKKYDGYRDKKVKKIC